LRDYASVLRKLKKKKEAAAMEARAKNIDDHCGLACQAGQTIDVLVLRPMGK
jgi:hypothetical protein